MRQQKNLMEKTNILITSAGRRVSLVRFFLKEIKENTPLSKLYCSDLNPELSSACQVADKSFKIIKVTHPEYIDALIKLCKKHAIGLIIPTIDSELEVLAKNKELLISQGITPVVSDYKFIRQCRDKRLIHRFFDDIRFKRAVEFDKKNITYPTFVKPVDGSRSQGIHIINSEKELTDELVSNEKNMFLEYLNPINFTEFTVDLYCNKASEIISIIPRERIFVRDGEVNKACTRKNSIIAYIREKFKDVKGLYGCITFQVFKHHTNNTIVAIEINPRFGGGYPLSYLAGANFPKWILEEYMLNKKIEGYQENWKSDLLMLRYDSEILVNDYKN